MVEQEVCVKEKTESQPPVLKPPVRKYSKLQKDELAIVLVMVIPQIILAIVFYFYVNLSSFAMAFQNPSTGAWTMDMMKQAWSDIVSSNSDIGIGIRNTMLYFIKDNIMLVFQLGVAYFFYKKLKFSYGFQIIFYLPGIVSGVALTTIFKCFINPSGPLEVLLGMVGIENMPYFLGQSNTATWTIMFYTIWTGWAGNMLLFNGALARIPLEVLESARLDGISSGKEFTHIIFPLIWPTFSTLLILGLTGILGAGGPILLFVKEGSYKTWTIGYWMFNRIAENGGSKLAYHMVSATGLIFTVIAAPIILGLRKVIELIPAVEY